MRWLICGVTMALLAMAANGQESFTLDQGLMDHQVLQCDDNDLAMVVCSGTAGELDGPVEARVAGEDGEEILAWHEIGQAAEGVWEGTLAGIPGGGPYTVQFRLDGHEAQAEQVLAGELWILAGQSNMQGVGNMENVAQPHPQVHVFAMNDDWRVAEEPLHRRGESVDPVHNPNAAEGLEIDVTDWTKGAGLGLSFAKARFETTGRPVGLIPCAHGGTSMDQWDPARRDEYGESLYGAMYRRFQAAGGAVTGVLWYQGESDRGAADAYEDKFRDFIEALRADFGDPALPFYYVQIGGYATTGDSLGWNTVQNAQTNIEKTMAGVAMAPSIDLALDDPIHIGTEGLKTLGVRLAGIAARMDAGQQPPEASGPRLASVERRDSRFGSYLEVRLEGVVDGLQAPGGVRGFSLTDGDDEPLQPIYKQVIVETDEGEAIQLWSNQLPEDLHLWYGRGLFPNCTVTDGAGRALPVFGPVPVP